jgi:putative radical SAM enzyme (TIGR03279 family)
VSTHHRSAGGLIAAVQPESIGAEVGLEPGDVLFSINGHVLRDVIDYRYYGADERLSLVLERQGQRHTLDIERDYDEELGLEFSELVFDGLRCCDNRCPFCFVRQMPKGLRKTLYIRDDDYRYSFLLGNFVTLTNLTEEDWQRIAEQHLSPLYVSIHATDLDARRRILGNPQAPDILPQLQRLAAAHIDMHGQIVISPGVNDGGVLTRSIDELVALWPALRTLALVPVGLTCYHAQGVRPLLPQEAAAVVDMALDYAARFRKRLGRTWLYPSDELFLLAGRDVPPRSFYDDAAQFENGVGMLRALLEDWKRAKRRLSKEPRDRRISLVCGQLVAPTLHKITIELAEMSGLQARVISVANRFLGETVTVSGLLTGADVLEALDGEDLGERVFLPRAMLDAPGERTLDDLSPEALQGRLGCALSFVSTLSEALDALRSKAGAPV